ncbi:MAG: HlyD family efflux transporter periplasmic adaptor subunit [Pseudomonadota bacterium]
MSDLQFRVRAPLGLELGTGECLEITSWSLKEICFPDAPNVLPKKGILSIPFQGVDIRFPVEFAPGSEPGTLAFEGLNGRQRETLATFYRAILSGQMASTAEVITALDTPVDLVPMGETEAERDAGVEKQAPRSLRAALTVLLYAGLALAVFGVVGGQIWSRLTQIEVAQARVEAPIVAHRAPQAGYVDQLDVAVGDRVEAGDRLVRMSDPDHATRMEDIRADIEDQDRAVRRARERLRRHLETEDAARAPLIAAYEAAVAARRPEDFFAARSLEGVRAVWVALRRFDDGHWERVGDWHEERDVREDDLRQAKDDFRRLKRQLSAQKASGSAADVHALSSGTVTAIHVFRDQYAARGTLVVELEADADRLAVGWLDEHLSDAVYPGMSATLSINARGRKHRLPGRIVEVSAGAQEARPGQYGVRLAVLPEASSSDAVRALMRPDAPLRMTLDRTPAWALPRQRPAWIAALPAGAAPPAAGH